MKQFFILILGYFLIINSVTAQSFSPSISSGILFSDISAPWSENYTDGNTWKRFYWVGLRNHVLKKKWFSVDVGITYQERKALEVFAFPFGESSAATGSTTSMWIFSQYPTSPQSKGFYTHGNEYIHLPNFKYLYLEFAPKVRLGKNLQCEVGVGLFGGVLLNRKQVSFGREDFPNFDDFFEPPFNVYGKVYYHRYDYGWMPEINISYAISQKMRLGITTKSYQSLVRLNDTFVAPALAFNMRWTVFAGGIEFSYQF